MTYTQQALEALTKYGEHRPECRAFEGGYDGQECTCGLDEAIAALSSQPEAERVHDADRKYLVALIGATILANKPELREQDGKYELDFNPTVPKLVEVIHDYLTRQQAGGKA